MTACILSVVSAILVISVFLRSDLSFYYSFLTHCFGFEPRFLHGSNHRFSIEIFSFDGQGFVGRLDVNSPVFRADSFVQRVRHLADTAHALDIGFEF